MTKNIIDFDMPEATPSIIMVAGVGGGGSNAVNHMFNLGITDVSFMVCNTDQQALNRSQIPIKIVLGQSLTQGLGAGNKPEIGAAAAEESYQEILETFARYGTRMVFITAGMGGGTGTGAAPVIARAAKEKNILTIAIVTIPFKTEGRKRFNQALAGIEELRKHVDSLLVINNENILEMHGQLFLSEAFGMADDILATAAKGIAEIITGDSYINVDFADVQTVMSNSGVALMGSARAGGENRADLAVKEALASPLLNHRDISGAENILLNITSGTREVTLEETYHITDFVQEKTGYVADLIWGAGKDESLGDEIQVTIIATGFDAKTIEGFFEDTVSGATNMFKKPAAQPESGQNTEPNDAAPAVSETVEPAEESRTTAPEVPPTPAAPVVSDSPKPFQPAQPVDPVRASPFQPRQQGGRTTIVAGSDANYVVTERALEPQDPAKEEAINYEELEKRPAWLRRKMTFTDVPADERTVSRVTLKEDQAVKPKADQQNNALFD